MREMIYEKESVPDTDLVARLFSRTLRSLPLESNMEQTKLTQTNLRCQVKAPSQRLIFAKIHKESQSLWGSY